MTIAVGADHAGYDMKEQAKLLLQGMSYVVKDFGTSSKESTDYPDYAHGVAGAVAKGEADYGILVCGTGIGMSIVANKHSGVRASNVESLDAARYARAHNNANVLALGARLTTWERAADIIRIFLSTPFEGGRHSRRVEKIHTLTGR
jgi:ribose 5-phosphate isomerase B